MKLKVVSRKIYDYIRYDLKEIAFPSSLPDPHIQKRRKLTWPEKLLVVKKAARLYVASWHRDIRPDLYPEEFKRPEDGGDKPQEGKHEPKEKEDSTWDDLAVAARGGMETLRPVLQRIYMTRASAYTDALKCFIEGYQEGIRQTLKQNDPKSQKENGKTDTSV